EDKPAEEGTHDHQAARGAGRLQGSTPASRDRPPGGERDKDRRAAEWVHDDHQGDEGLPKGSPTHGVSLTLLRPTIGLDGKSRQRPPLDVGRKRRTRHRDTARSEVAPESDPTLD